MFRQQIHIVKDETLKFLLLLLLMLSFFEANIHQHATVERRTLYTLSTHSSQQQKQNIDIIYTALLILGETDVIIIHSRDCSTTKMA